MGQVPFLAPSYPLGLLKSQKNFLFFFFRHLTSISPLRYHFHRAQNHFFHLFRPFLELWKKKIFKNFWKIFQNFFNFFNFFSSFLPLSRQTNDNFGNFFLKFSRLHLITVAKSWQNLTWICWKSLKIDRNDVISRVLFFSPFFLSFFHSHIPI